MASPNFNSRQDVTPGVAEAVSPLVRRVVAGNASPYTFTGTATYIVGAGEVAIIDPGPDEEAHLQALLDATRGERVSHILVTHTHLDHTGLRRRLVEATGAPTFGFGPHGSGRPVRLAAAAAGEAGGDRDFVPDYRIGDGDVVEGQGWRLRAVHTPGHTSNHLSFALDAEAAFFSGDHVMGWSTTMVAPPDGHMGDYMASLRALLERKDDVYWPGHGGPVEQPRRFVRALISHREAREQAFLKRLQEGDRTVGQIVESVYRGLDERLKRPAALTALAHLIDLVERGDVEVLGPLGLEAEFRPAG
jgi:glyoxylase-like metal-dependent hydrolase (beta-lactamase superfamily II)